MKSGSTNEVTTTNVLARDPKPLAYAFTNNIPSHMGKHQVKARNIKKLKAFGKNLKRIRLEKGWSQEKLAVRAGISENTVVTLEAGKLNTTIATCFDIAKALGVEVSILFQQ